MPTQSGDKTLAILAHILGLFAGFIPSLIIYLVAKDSYSKEHARNALNWQISLAIYIIGSIILMIILIGILIFFALWIMNIIFIIIGTVKASEGEMYKYPLAIPFLK